MGRLDRLRPSRLSLWLMPGILSMSLLIGFHTYVQAGTPPTTNELAEYLISNELEMIVESVEGYQQIYYLYDGAKIQLTSAAYSHINPASDGPTVAWQGLINGEGQIFAYDILTKALTQLTFAGSNQN